MAFRSATISCVVADDSTLQQRQFGERKATVYQTKDLEVFSTNVRVAPADAEATIAIAPVVAGYFFCLFADYPIRVRLNGAAATQFLLTSSGVAPVSVGAPLPDQCVFIATASITEVRLQPIVGAAQTANVRICVTGDPLNAYT